MSKFKVGSLVKIIGKPDNNHNVGDVGRVISNNYEEWPYKVVVIGKMVDDEQGYGTYHQDELELIKGEQTMGRRTFRLLKEGPTALKGAVFQEECDDGTQPYICITPEYIKGNLERIHLDDRNLVENQPKFFEEVFPLVPEYGNKAELEAFKKFAKKRK